MSDDIAKIEAALAETPKYLEVREPDLEIEDRWTGETYRTYAGSRHRIDNPEHRRLRVELQGARDALAAALWRRDIAETKAALLAARRAAALARWHRNFTSPLGQVSVTVRESEIDIDVALKSGKSGSSSFCLYKLELRRSAYLTGEPRRVAEEICAAIATHLAEAVPQ